MRADRWPDFTVAPEVLVDSHPHALHSTLVCVGHPDFIDQLLAEAEEAGSATARQTAELVLEVEIHTTQHDPRPEIVGQCNRIIHNQQQTSGGADNERPGTAD